VRSHEILALAVELLDAPLDAVQVGHVRHRADARLHVVHTTRHIVARSIRTAGSDKAEALRKGHDMRHGLRQYTAECCNAAP
jgi:hypothetical protein